MAQNTVAYYNVSAAATVTVDHNLVPDVWWIYAENPISLSGDYSIDLDGMPHVGTSWKVYYNVSNVNRNGHDIKMFGQTLTDAQIAKGGIWEYSVVTDDGVTQIAVFNSAPLDFDRDNTIYGDCLVDGTVLLTKLWPGTNAQTIVCGGSGDPQYVDVTGDVTIDNTGVTSISSGVIVDADINASAGITRSKLASGTASHVIINNGSGVISSEAQLANSRGGTGLNSSSSTGFPKVSSGTWSVGSIAVDRDLNVSFEAGETGDFKIKMGFDGTLTDIYAFATKVIAGTDNGTIVPKNNAGTTMTSGTITFTASDARGTAYTSSPSANNTFVAGNILTFTTAKTTSGGKVHLSLKFTRNS